MLNSRKDKVPLALEKRKDEYINVKIEIISIIIILFFHIISGK